MKLEIEADVPAGTKVDYYFRRGSNPQPFSCEWEEYKPVGNGPSLMYEASGVNLNRRFVQFKAVLSTDNPLVSPVIKNAKITANLLERVPLHGNIHLISAVNDPIQYSSVNWEWEKWDRPEFRKIKAQENLDEVIEGSRTELEAQVRLLDYVTKRWRHSTPFPEYPGWDAKSILDRIDDAGAGGMCIQFNNVLGGLCMAYGWQARLINVVIHEVIEVWNDDYGKWVFMDADYENNYNYDPETAEPLNLLELHNRYLDYYFPGKSIDWMNDMVKWMDPVEGKTIPVKRGSLTNHEIKVPYHKNGAMSGFINSAFMRMIPRNNFYEKPTPLPVSHGSGTNWPWNGYVNWYDGRTPVKRQYSWHTDRPRDMWPDLNKVYIHANSGFGNDRLFLRFETYTPNFSHFEVNVDDTGWKTVEEKYTWLLQSGRNSIKVRAVSKLGAKGYPSCMVLNYADAPFDDHPR